VVFAVADVAAVGTAVVALDRQAVEKPSLGFLGNRDEAVVVAVAVVVVVTVAAEVVLAHLVVEAGAVGNPESLQKNVVDEVLLLMSYNLGLQKVKNTKTLLNIFVTNKHEDLHVEFSTISTGFSFLIVTTNNKIAQNTTTVAQKQVNQPLSQHHCH